MKKFLTALITAFLAVPATANAVNYTAQDMHNLNNFLLTGSPGILRSLYDLTGDGVIDVFDLCLMRKHFLNNNEEKSDILVAYFSRTGNTEKIADPIDSIKSYDVVFLGYPIWWGEEPRIIDTFLESYDFSDKTVIPFCTSGSTGISASEKNISELISAGNQLAGKRFASNATEKDVSDWIDTLNLPDKKKETIMNIEVNGHTLSATLADNSSAEALAKLIGNKSLTLSLDDYANFEKTGTLPEALPTNNEQINTDYGDLILYQGNKFVIYYDKNSWSLTRLGHINNVTQEELKKILGTGSVEVTLSLAK
ncbi:MAG: cyclophilin-like fold protein [Ruminococcus flavefaciens]|nr:cyclophilin-like fold protein [Ruminococcus flavefaciens]